MSLLHMDQEELGRLRGRIEDCCVVFHDHPLPTGVQPPIGRIGVETREGSTWLLVDHGLEYRGSSEQIARFLSEGEQRFDHLDDAVAWLRDVCSRVPNRERPRQQLSFDELRGRIIDHLGRELVDQDDAIIAVAGSTALHLAKIEPRSPLVVLAGGPTGTGKTTTARLLAELLPQLTDEPWSTVHIDCAELDDHHRIAGLLGSPPGYAGSNRPPELIAKLSAGDRVMVILDEFEKAHPDVQRLFLGAFDGGRLRPGSGDEPLDVRHCIFFLTTNVAHESLGSLDHDLDRKAPLDPAERAEAYRRMLVAGGMEDTLVGRITAVLPYRALTPDAIAALTIGAIRQVAAEYGVKVGRVEPDAAMRLIESCLVNMRLGARSVRRRVDDHLGHLLSATPAGGGELTLAVHEGVLKFDHEPNSDEHGQLILDVSGSWPTRNGRFRP